MVNPICGYDADGNMLSGDEIRERNAKIKSEIIQVLGKYNLTLGQALGLLTDCRHEITDQVALRSFAELMKEVRET